MTINDCEQLTCIELDPNHPAKRSVIVLHGLGADGSDFVPIVPELKLPENLAIRFVFPHAPIMPISINNGYPMRAWYDISPAAFSGHTDERGLNKSIAQVETLINNEIARGISSENIILAGFSQGAVIALLTGLSFKKPLGGVIALSGYLPLANKFLHTNSINKHLAIFLAHGTEDSVVPYALGKAAYLVLKDAHYNVDWHSYPIAHTVSAQEINDISKWLQKRW